MEHLVTRIEYDPIGNVRVHCRLSDNSVTVLEADAVVVSVSLGVLKSGYVKESMLGLPRERKKCRRCFKIIEYPRTAISTKRSFSHYERDCRYDRLSL